MKKMNAKQFLFLPLCLTLATGLFRNEANAFCLYFENKSDRTLIISEAHANQTLPPYSLDDILKAKPFRIYPGQTSQGSKLCTNCCWNYQSILDHFKHKQAPVTAEDIYNLTKLHVKFFDPEGNVKTKEIDLNPRTDFEFQIGGYMQVTFEGGGKSGEINVLFDGYNTDQSKASHYETTFTAN